MSLYDYNMSETIARQDLPFDALIMAAMRKADTGNAAKLSAVFPDLADELQARYDAPGGRLKNDLPPPPIVGTVAEVRKKKGYQEIDILTEDGEVKTVKTGSAPILPRLESDG